MNTALVPRRYKSRGKYGQKVFSIFCFIWLIRQLQSCTNVKQGPEAGIPCSLIALRPLPAIVSGLLRVISWREMPPKISLGTVDENQLWEISIGLFRNQLKCSSGDDQILMGSFGENSVCLFCSTTSNKEAHKSERKNENRDLKIWKVHPIIKSYQHPEEGERSLSDRPPHRQGFQQTTLWNLLFFQQQQTVKDQLKKRNMVL